MRTKSIWCLAAAAAVLSLSACKAEEKKAITIGASNFTEVNILGNIYRELIEADMDIEVKTSLD